ncbi:hypothetical protein C7974DRAFT_395227 [Boeremia exigua]|uniref:uncharacterized protein n=1 Tax=Boeremia exigua TaxID=749465 RepID=UPI001E8EC7AE|nr:uncharacterized protein C7974DRAFT_395227 [Boeremia exigua]KAH6629790.1 hypothetical protein C7974DRAFT_395227 [Boeremia exigua]
MRVILAPSVFANPSLGCITASARRGAVREACETLLCSHGGYAKRLFPDLQTPHRLSSIQALLLKGHRLPSKLALRASLQRVSLQTTTCHVRSERNSIKANATVSRTSNHSVAGIRGPLSVSSAAVPYAFESRLGVPPIYPLPTPLQPAIPHVSASDQPLGVSVIINPFSSQSGNGRSTTQILLQAPTLP